MYKKKRDRKTGKQADITNERTSGWTDERTNK